MRVLLIKTSSMGDIIHTLPALSDAKSAIKEITFDWVVEDTFKEIPAWHDAVNSIIPISFRRWRKNLFKKETRMAWKALRKTLSLGNYNLILDAQGLMKSAIISLNAKGERVGLDWSSARESIASLFYHRKCTVNFKQHAITRTRQLFSQALGYTLPTSAPRFAINKNNFFDDCKLENYIVFLHGTSWDSKLWPEAYWTKLATLAAQAGILVKLTGASIDEIERAKRIASASSNVEVLPNLKINEMAKLLANARAAIAVDTGFGHLAAALSIPTVSLYGATDPKFTGAIGTNSLHLTGTYECSPCLQRKCTVKNVLMQPACFQSVTPEIVWRRVRASCNLC